jgi:hypothetical protein
MSNMIDLVNRQSKQNFSVGEEISNPSGALGKK